MAILNARPSLVCPAGSLRALKAAVDNGADAVYLGLRNETNARNFPGLNFDEHEIKQAVEYGHQRNTKILLALNTFPQGKSWSKWVAAIELAAKQGLDAVILADLGLLRFASRNFPDLRLHLSVQGSATNRYAIDFCVEEFGIRQVVLPRVLSLAQIRRIIEKSSIDVEVFGFGSLCIMVEGRCALSSYVTAESPNTCGVCSPAKAVRWLETSQGRQSRLNNILIDQYRHNEAAGYPTLCKGRFTVLDKTFYAMEEPTSLNTLDILPALMDAGVAAIKIEGRQRSPAYVAQVTRVMRHAIDLCYDHPQHYKVNEGWMTTLNKVSEGQSHTLGAIDRKWQ